MQSSQLDLHTPSSKKAIPPLGQIRLVNFEIQWRGKWQRYPCYVATPRDLELDFQSSLCTRRESRMSTTLACDSASKIDIVLK